EVGARVRRLGDQAEAVRRQADGQLEDDEDRGCSDREERRPALWRHVNRLQIAAERLFALDRLEQRFEVAVAEAARAVALDHLEEERRSVLSRVREDLEQIA